ncbi:MAG: glycoside hydrolase family 9 protein [Melioribacteraceae bacterium]|nr:glycoside hydrolase family 9 protein [Melioribacteraceae bacterium]
MKSFGNYMHVILTVFLSFTFIHAQQNTLKINDSGYYEIPSLNVMMFDDFYPEGHQGGLSIVQFGKRIAANGDLRLEPTPGQWSPVPKVGERIIDRENGMISASLAFPDSTKDKKGFNPVDYPDLKFRYTIKTEAVGNQIKLTVNLEDDLPEEWIGKVGFNLEIFPGHYFGEHYLMDGKSGSFPQQANGPVFIDDDGNLQIEELAVGSELIIAPGNIQNRFEVKSLGSPLQLIDGRGLHNNGWFILRSVVDVNSTENEIEWLITPSYDLAWRYNPVVQVSQVGYHPAQSKFAVVELDKLEEKFKNISLIRIDKGSQKIIKSEIAPTPWGEFLRYKYIRFDFSEIKEEGLYFIKYGENYSNRFEIKKSVFSRHVWQPTLEYFLPVQMCHMKVIEKYRTWHGLCHMDDARMAPINHNHFDGYIQGGSTLTNFNPGENVPGLNSGGWHDAGDYDLRVESQAGTIYKLALAYYFFGDKTDQTTIDNENNLVEIHKPDGKPDILQQIEHGLYSVIGAYESLGRLYRGIICPTLDQYVLLGDGSTMTDNFHYRNNENDPILNKPLPEDDRWVFTENNPRRELAVIQKLAFAGNVLKEFNPQLAGKSLNAVVDLFEKFENTDARLKINAAAELFLATDDKKYADVLFENTELIAKRISDYGATIGRFVEKSDDEKFNETIKAAVKIEYAKIVEQQKSNPYGIPYEPHIWGAGWGIQEFGVNLLFLHLGFPEIVSTEYAFNALNFVLGCHPGENTASFVSGVGSKSLTVAYGVNRADWSYIPGGVASGTALIRPDLPELKEWPYFWQQTEYVIGGGGTNFMLLAMAADYLMKTEL